MTKMHDDANRYEAYVLRVWHSQTPPHCRLMLKRIASEETWYFHDPAELGRFLQAHSAEVRQQSE